MENDHHGLNKPRLYKLEAVEGNKYVQCRNMHSDDADISDYDDQEVVSEPPTLFKIISDHDMELETTIPIVKAKISELQPHLDKSRYERAIEQIFELYRLTHYSSDAFYISVTYLNIVLSKTPIAPDLLQLVAAVCYCLAVKVDTRLVMGFVDVNNALRTEFTNTQFQETEEMIRNQLEWIFSYPTAKIFTRYIFEESILPQDRLIRVMTICNWFLQTCVVDTDYIDTLPSLFATSAAAVSAFAVGEHKEATQIIFRSRNDLHGLLTCCGALIRLGKEKAPPPNNKSSVGDFNFDFQAQDLMGPINKLG